MSHKNFCKVCGLDLGKRGKLYCSKKCMKIAYISKALPRKKEYIKRYMIKRYREDSQFNIRIRLGNLLSRSMKRYTITGKIYKSKKYGIDYKKIIEHLKPFPQDMSKYQIDHIRPLRSFNLNDPIELRKAFAPENHQWLLESDNKSKGGRWKPETETFK